MSLKDQLSDDLGLKLKQDLKRAMEHYAEMCALADIEEEEQWARVISSLMAIVLQLAQSGGMPKEAFLEALGNQWDHNLKRKSR